MNTIVKLSIAALAVALVACSDSATSANSLSPSAASQAFLTTPVGFSNVNSSFDASGDLGEAFHAERGRGGPGFGGLLMGGGLGPDFFGGLGFEHGRGPGHGPFGGGALPSSCPYSTSTLRVTCTDTARGLIIVRSAAYTKANGTAQSAVDSTTNTINLAVTVNGTTTHHNDTSVVSSSSDRTVSGLAVGSTQRTVAGTSRGTESTRGVSDSGAFTATRVAGDTTRGVIIPVPSSTSTTPVYPTAGTVIRQMTATITFAGKSPSTSTRREVVTYNGTATATVVITENGVTKNCTLPLPRGRLTCS